MRCCGVIYVFLVQSPSVCFAMNVFVLLCVCHCFIFFLIVLYFSNFLYVSFWFFVFYPISLFDFFGCLFLTFIDVSSIPFSLPCSLLRILIFLFVFCLLLFSLSFTTTLFFCCFHSRLKSPKNQSICSKKRKNR